MNKIFLLLLTSLFISSVSFAQSTIKGNIKNKSTNKAIQKVNTKLYKSNKLVQQTQTNTAGEFSFTGLTNGVYRLEATQTNYLKIEVAGIVFTKDTIVKLDLKMNSLVPELDSIVVLEIVDDDIDVMDYESVVECDEFLGFTTNANASTYRTSKREGAYGYPQQMNTESYDFIKENTFQNTRSNPLSTFSIDVDRASYANMRRFLNMHQKPPKDAVRIEEMINYFDYSYPQPKDAHPFSINMEGGECPWNTQHKIVHIGLQGEDMITESIPANNLVFLLDVSGSMNSPNKLPLLKKSFHILLEQMRPQDRVAIVVYAGAAGVVLPSTSNKERIRAALNKLSAGGSTAGGAGIQLAYKIATENFIQGGNNRIILATDGDFNVGVSDNGSLVRMIEKKRETGVYLSILGFGMGNYKDSRMEQLSNAGNGNYAYIDNILEANKVFGKELWGTLYTIAKDVKIQIEFNPAYVKAYRLIGYENRMLENKDFNDDKKDAGEIGSGHSVTAIYEIIPVGVESKWATQDSLKYQQTQSVDNSGEVCTVKFRYKKPDSDKSTFIKRTLHKRELNSNANPSNNFKWALAVAEFGMLLRDSEFKGTANYASVLRRAKEAKGIDEYGYRSEFIQLVQKANLLDK